MWIAKLNIADIEINDQDTAWSRSFPFNGNPNSEYGIEVQFDSTAGTPSVQMELELSNVKLTEAQQGLTNANYVVGDRDTPIGTVSDELIHFIGFNSIPARYGRIKFTGLSDNDSDTVLTNGNITGAA